MNRKIPFHELAVLLAGNCNITPAEAEDFIKSFFDLLTQTLTDGETVKIKGIGTFTPTGDKDNPVTFTPDVEIADSINAPFAMFEPEEVSDTLSDEALNDLDTPTPIAEQETEQTPKPEPTANPELEPKVEPQPVLEPTAEPIAEPQPSPEPKAEPIAEPQPSPEPKVEPIAEPQPSPEPKAEPIAEPQSIPVAIPQSDSSESSNSSEHSDTSEAQDSKLKPTISFPDEEPEEYISEPEQKSGVGFGWGFIIGMLVGLALGACGVYFAIDYIFPTTPTEYNLQAEEDAQPLAEIESLDSIATPQENDSVTAAATPVANPDTVKAPTPAPAAPAPAPAPTVIKDTVRPGYLLNDMAKKHYGNKCFWVYIYEENKAKIANPNRVGQGLVLVIPPAEKYGIDSSNRASIKAANEKAGKILSKYPK